MRVFQISCLVLVILLINSSFVFSASANVCKECGGCLSVKSSDGKLINCADPPLGKLFKLVAGCHSCDCCGGCIDILLNDDTLITCKRSSVTILKDKTVIRY